MSEVIPRSLSHSFSGRNVLVTGGGQGIGRALVERLYMDGANVFVLEKNATSVDELKKEFPKATVELADVSDWEQTQKIIEGFAPMHHLVNNAGVAVMENFLNVTESTYDTQMDINLKGTFLVTQAVAKKMISSGSAGGCTIVNIASLAATLVSDNASVYSASKGGVVLLTKSMAVEMGKHNIRVNCVSPTGVDTPLMRQHIDLLPPDLFIFRQPLAREKILTLDEMVNNVLFLLSPLSSMTTGFNLIVDGGISCC